MSRLRQGDLAFQIVNAVILLLLVVFTLYPFWNTVAVSFNSAADTMRSSIYLFPRQWTLQNYQAVFATGTLANALLVSVARTTLSTVLSLFLTAMLAYSLGRREFALRKPLTAIVVFTMYIGAGLIPIYFLYKGLGLINTFWVYVVPGLISGFNFIVIRTYIQTIPESLVESARMDGGGDFRIFMRIILPLSAPVLATVALFVAVGAWNSWFDTQFFASGKQELSTLQFELMKFLSASQSQSKTAADVGALGMAKDFSSSMVTPVSIRAAITVVAAVPILIVYPFLQRHFVTGLSVGGVKE